MYSLRLSAHSSRCLSWTCCLSVITFVTKQCFSMEAYHNLFIDAAFNGCLSYFHLLAIIITAGMNIIGYLCGYLFSISFE